jgi:hypothetical protein
MDRGCVPSAGSVGDAGSASGLRSNATSRAIRMV